MLNKTLSVTHSIEIEATPASVWDVLINPEKIKRYLFGTETISDWKKGGSLIFQVEYENTKYRDHGIIREIIPEKELQYTYLSEWSGLEDIPENHSLITFTISQTIKNVVLKLIQTGYEDGEAMNKSKQTWTLIMEEMKTMAEE